MPTETIKPEIPELKKRDEDRERKGSGFAWSGAGASPIGSEFFGASEQGILGMGRLAASFARILGGPSSIFGRLLLSKAGSWLMLAIVGSGLVAGMAAGAWVMTHIFASGQSSSSAAPTLDGISDSIRVRREHNGGPNVRTTLGARFDDGNLPAAPTPPDMQTAASPATDAIAEKPVAPTPAGTGNMDGLLDQAKKVDLNALGKGLSAGTGGASTSAGLPNLQKQTLASNDFKLTKQFVPPPIQLKSLTPFDQRRPMVSTKEGIQNAKSQRAIGQLKFAKDMSGAGTTAGSQEAGKNYSTSAFEQGTTSGGQIGGLTEGSTITPPGDGAPSYTDNSGTNVTPYQNQINNAQQNSGAAAALEAAGIAAIAAGLAMLMAGLSMLNDPATAQMGMMLAMAGLALILAGIAMLAMAQSLKNQAQNQGNNIANQYGQQQQGNTVNNCASQAANSGVQPANCNSTFYMPVNNTQEAVTQESNSTYSLDGGSPIH